MLSRRLGLPESAWQGYRGGALQDVLATDIRTAYGFRLKNTPVNLRQALCAWQGVR